MNVFGTVTTTSPGCTPAAMRAKRNASVPLPTPTQCDVSQKAAKAFSNCCTIGPPMKVPVLRACRNTATSSFSRTRCREIRSRNGMLSFEVICHSQGLCNMSKDSGRISGNDAVRRHVLGHHTSRTYNCIFAHRNLGEYGRAGTDRGSLLDDCPLHGPVALGLERPLSARGTGIRVVDEHHAMTDENAVFDGHAFANERVAGDLAALSYFRVLLNLDKRADFRIIADFTTVQINESR